MGAIIDNGPLIKKIYVPKYVFVLSRIFSSSINLLASFTALIFVMLAMRVELHYTVLLVPIPLFFIVFFKRTSKECKIIIFKLSLINIF